MTKTFRSRWARRHVVGLHPAPVQRNLSIHALENDRRLLDLPFHDEQAQAYYAVKQLPLTRLLLRSGLA